MNYFSYLTGNAAYICKGNKSVMKTVKVSAIEVAYGRIL